MSSILLANRKTVDNIPIDKIFVIYGEPGSGKTTLVSTFPKTKQAPMLLITVRERGVSSIAFNERDNIEVLEVETLEEFDSVLSDLESMEATDASGKLVKLNYSTIAVDNLTQLETAMIEYILKQAGKPKMTLQEWGDLKKMHTDIRSKLKAISRRHKCNLALICHSKDDKTEASPTLGKVVPSLSGASAALLCGDSSFVWYMKTDRESIVDASTNEVKEVTKFNTIICEHPDLVTKTRRPQGLALPEKVTDMTYDKFARNILSRLTNKGATGGTP